MLRMTEWRFALLKEFVRRPDFFKAPHDDLKEYPCNGRLSVMLEQEIEDVAAHVARLAANEARLIDGTDTAALVKAQARLQLLALFARRAFEYTTDEFEKALRE